MDRDQNAALNILHKALEKNLSSDFSMLSFTTVETPPNVPFVPGVTSDAFVMLVVLGY